MNYLEAGKIVNTHGLRGEVKLVPWTDSPQTFEEIDYVFIKKKTGDVRLDIERLKYQKNNLIVKFNQISSIEEAEKLKNQTVYIDRDALGELPEGVYYIADIIGLAAVDESGNAVGTVVDIFNTGANDIYDIKREGKKNLLLPVIDDVITVDLENERVIVKIPEGLDD